MRHSKTATDETVRATATDGSAHAIAYAYIAGRERTVAEVEAKLARAGVESGEATAAIDELRTFGYLDDARYARLFAQDKRSLEQWGGERIDRELTRRGIARELIIAALSEEPGETELDRALALLERRFPVPPADRRERERALGMLVRKGYDGDLALDALSRHASGASRHT